MFDVFNWIDLTSATLNFLVLFSFGWGLDIFTENTARLMAAISVVFMWAKVFYWMRLFSQTSYYIRMVVDTLSDVSTFLILFFAILFTFGNAIFILNYNRKLSDEEVAQLGEEEDPEAELLIGKHFNSAVINIMVNQYLLSLGEFEGLDAFDGADKNIVWFCFLMATFITQITFLNMLVAIMGDSYAKVTETKDQSALVEKIKIMADYISVVKDKHLIDRYLTVSKPQDEDGGNEWEGTVSMLKKSIDGAVKDLQSVFNKKLAVVN